MLVKRGYNGENETQPRASQAVRAGEGGHMTELEKIDYARRFIEKLANGVDPLTDQPVPDGELVNNVRISRCFTSSHIEETPVRMRRGSEL